MTIPLSEMMERTAMMLRDSEEYHGVGLGSVVTDEFGFAVVRINKETKETSIVTSIIGNAVYKSIVSAAAAVPNIDQDAEHEYVLTKCRSAFVVEFAVGDLKVLNKKFEKTRQIYEMQK